MWASGMNLVYLRFLSGTLKFQYQLQFQNFGLTLLLACLGNLNFYKLLLWSNTDFREVKKKSKEIKAHQKSMVQLP